MPLQSPFVAMHTHIRHAGNVGKNGLAAKAAAGFIADSNVTSLCEEDDVEAPPFELLGPNRYSVTYALKRNAL